MNPSNCSKIFDALSPLENLAVVFEVNLPDVDAAIVALRRLDGVVHFLRRHGCAKKERLWL